MKRSELKQLIKECMYEILSESFITEAVNRNLKNLVESNGSTTKQIKNEIANNINEKRTIVSRKPDLEKFDPSIRNILKETLESTPIENIFKEKPLNESDDLAKLGVDPSTWEVAAFSEKINDNVKKSKDPYWI